VALLRRVAAAPVVVEGAEAGAAGAAGAGGVQQVGDKRGRVAVGEGEGCAPAAKRERVVGDDAAGRGPAVSALVGYGSDSDSGDGGESVT